MDITYTLNLTVTRPVYLHDTEGSLQDTAEWMQSTEAKRELEKEVLKTLRRLDGDCDVEVMDTEAVGEIEDDEDDKPAAKLTRQERLEGLADRGCDTWEEARSER